MSLLDGSTPPALRVLLLVSDPDLLAALAGIVQRLGSAPIPIATPSLERPGQWQRMLEARPQLVVQELVDPVQPALRVARCLRDNLGPLVPFVAFSHYDDLLQQAVAQRGAYHLALPGAEMSRHLLHWLRQGQAPGAPPEATPQGTPEATPPTAALRGFLEPLGGVVRRRPRGS